MTHTIFDMLHKSFYRWVAYPALKTTAQMGASFVPKLAQGIKLRQPVNGVSPWLVPPPHTQPIWIHCASGELEYAKPVIQLLKQRNPGQKILLTYFSPSVEKAAHSLATVDYAVPLPWDDPHSLQEFIRHHRPRVLAVSRTDTWPEMLIQCHDSGVPVVLFSATLGSQNPKLQRPISRAYHAWLFTYLTEILCVTESDYEQFKSLGVGDKTKVVGDSRYDQVMIRLKNPKPLKENLKPTREQFVLVAGSTWPHDEKVLIPALKQLMEFGVRPILAPHEPSPSHLNDMIRELEKYQLKYTRYSSAQAWHTDQVLILDQVGILAELYQWADIAFVGNSFQKHAIHSVMEPLAAGCMTLFGPYHHNNREALAFKKISRFYPSLGFAQEIQSSKDLIEAVLRIINHPSFAEIKREIQQEVRKRAGASLKIVQHIENHIQNHHWQNRH